VDNISSYIRWRGDITFAEREFNLVDNLVLAQLAYVDFSAVASASGSVTLADAYDIIKASGTYQTLILKDFSDDLLAEAARSVRFGNTKISNVVDECDAERQIQFAALHFALDDGSIYVAFRGTDVSFVGWREDFMMGFTLVPSQTAAVEYLKETMDVNTIYRVGGQSKGGNLAVYSSMMLESRQQERIIAVYDNDGPGLSAELIETEGYVAIYSKLIRVLPEYSVIGNLFEHKDCETVIVKSSASGITQ
jgi:hypothetical protein